MELAEYKKRLSLASSTRTPNNLSARHPAFGHAVIGNLNDVNFQFEFPKFGQLPGPAPSQSNNAQTNGRPSASPRTASDQVSPTDSSQRQGSTQSNGVDTQTKDDLATFSGIFSPPLTNNVVASAARGSADSNNNGAATSSSSPSASSNSNGGPSSSCGTSPEPTNNQSPVSFKPEALGTIGEETHPSLNNANSGKTYHWLSFEDKGMTGIDSSVHFTLLLHVT